MNEVEIVVTGTNRAGIAFSQAVQDADKLGRKVKGLDDIKTHLGKNLENDVKNAVPALTKILGKAAETGADLFGNGISKAFSSLPPQAQAAIGAAIAVAIGASATLIGAALTGVLLAGVAAAGIGGAIALQLSNPDVKTAITAMGQNAKASLTQASAGFAPILIQGAHQFNAEISKLQPTFARIFSSLEGPAKDLFTGIVGLVDRMMPGIEKATRAGGQILSGLAHDLPGLGAAISDMFSSLAGGASGAGDALHQMLTWIEGIIRATGLLLEGLSKVYSVSEIIGDVLTMNTTDLASHFNGTRKSADDLTSQIDNLNNSTKDLATSSDLAAGAAMSASDQFGGLLTQLSAVNNTADTVAGALSDKLFNAMMGLDQANLNFEESLTKVSSAIEKNGRQLDIHTAKGQANQEAIFGAVQKNIALYDANIKSGMSAQEAAAAYDQNTAALEAQLKKAGLTQGAIDGLIGKYKNVPHNVDTNIAMNGLTNAIEDLDTLLRQINGLHDKTITIQEHVYTYTDPQHLGHGLASGGIATAASGGPRGLTWVGERGAELVKLPQGSMVYSHGDSQRMANNMANSNQVGGGSGAIGLYVANGTENKVAALIDWLVRCGYITTLKRA